jgi:predicted acyltransferase
MYRTMFLSWLDPINASLAFAITFVLFWFAVLYVLYRKQIFFRV